MKRERRVHTRVSIGTNSNQLMHSSSVKLYFLLYISPGSQVFVNVKVIGLLSDNLECPHHLE